MRSLVKIKSSRKGEITDAGKSCPSSEFLVSQICLLTLLAKISGFTVLTRIHFLKAIGTLFCALFYCNQHMMTALFKYSQFYSA